MSIDGLQGKLREFTSERDWERFHTPKNLVMALAGEAGELVAVFQWLSPDESSDAMAEPSHAERVRDEIADVFAYLLRLADVLGIDLEAALAAKMIKNAQKYPVHAARGSGRKYTDLP
jgi:NTP pyrophosphatase (non-canonical NTP hydrolase)